MKKIIAVVLTTLVLSGCAIESKPPVCHAEMVLHKQLIQVPIFAVQDVKGQEYLAGAPFQGWTNAEQFVNLNGCPNPGQ